MAQRPLAVLLLNNSLNSSRLARRFDDVGFRTSVSARPLDALVGMKDEVPAVVVLEAQLLRGDGLMFLRVLRSNTQAKALPVVAYGPTLGLPPHVLGEAQQLGVSKRIQVDGDRRQLLRVLRRVGVTTPFADEPTPSGPPTPRPSGRSQTQTDSIPIQPQYLSRPGAPQPTEPVTATSSLSSLGPIAFAAVDGQRVPTSVMSARRNDLQVVTGRHRLGLGSSLRLHLKDRLAVDDAMTDVDVRLLVRPDRERQNHHGWAYDCTVLGVNPVESYEDFVQHLNRSG